MQDTWISTKVKSLLAIDRRFDAMDIDVSTRDGVVTLQGAVASPEQQRLLIESVQNVRGVNEVSDQLNVEQEG